MDRRKILLILAAMIAALGTLLVFLYAQGAESRAEEKFESVEILKAIEPIEPGESFDDAAAANKFQLESVPENQVIDGAQRNLSGLSGKVAISAIVPGEQIIADRWGGAADVTSSVVSIPDDKVAVAVNLTDAARVSSFVRPGSEVAIVVSVTKEPLDFSYTRTLLEKVTVIGVGETSNITKTSTNESGEETTEQLPATLMTIAVTQKEAEKIVWGATYGQLSFALLTNDSKVGKSAGVLERNLFD